MDEGGIPDAGNAIRNRDARQAAAAPEGRIPDAGDTFTNRDARQAAAFIEGVIPDTGDIIRDVVIGSCFPFRVSPQHGLLFIEQNPIDIRVVHVSRVNLNSHQANATREGYHPNIGDAIRDRDARQADAAIEGTMNNGSSSGYKNLFIPATLTPPPHSAQGRV